MKVNDFPFGELLKSAWQWTYKNKILWIISFFAGSGGYFMNMMPSGEDVEELSEASPSFANFISNTKVMAVEAPVIILVILAAIIVFFLFWLVGLAARAAVIRGLSEINLDKEYKFWGLVKNGFKKVWRLLLMSILWGLPNILLIILMIVGFMFGAWYGISLMIVSGLVFLLYNIYVTILRHYAYCEAVLNEKPAWLAIKSGVQVFNKNFGVVLVTALIQIGLAMVIGIGTILAILFIAVPFVVLGIIMSLGLGTAGIIVAAVLGAMALVVVSLVIRAGVSFFFNAFLTKVYWKLDK